MSTVAIVPVSDLLAVNAALEEQGFGANNFSVPAYSGTAASHAFCHWWNNASFAAAVAEFPSVITQTGHIQTGVDEQGYPIYTIDPVTRAQALVEAQGAVWGAKALELPSSGTAAVGYYQFDGSLWYVIQAFNRTTYSAHPSTYPALITKVRHPGSVEEWAQPLYQFGAYALANPFTGKPDEALKDGKRWYVSAANAAGANTYAPGVWGWTEVGETAGDPGAEPSTKTWVDTGATITALAGQVYRVSAVLTGLTVGQPLRLGPTKETTFKGYWPTLTTPSDYIQIDPYQSVTVGSKVWKWA